MSYLTLPLQISDIRVVVLPDLRKAQVEDDVRLLIAKNPDGSTCTEERRVILTRRGRRQVLIDKMEQKLALWMGEL